LSTKNNGGNPNGCKVISLSETPPKMDELVKMVQKPSDIDSATIQLGIPSELFNVDLATPADLSYLNIGLGQSVYIPKIITSREGGRKSLYFLCTGERVMAGIYVNGCGVMRRYITRLTGDSQEAQSGDIYKEELISREGRIIAVFTGALKITDSDKGTGEIEFAQTNDPQYAIAAGIKVEVWVLWSCIRVKVDKKEE
jgi:hypothetical protein